MKFPDKVIAIKKLSRDRTRAGFRLTIVGYIVTLERDALPSEQGA
ncbi:hypothetical protein D1BOALGB6SA_8078 [Olavius sp. associated proteobacterium Delta 1]|nr:hypothetical protein D1BOALGB6SA_8078 [Olavius sp. associated proteobacterium Delta 1]